MKTLGLILFLAGVAAAQIDAIRLSNLRWSTNPGVVTVSLTVENTERTDARDVRLRIQGMSAPREGGQRAILFSHEETLRTGVRAETKKDAFLRLSYRVDVNSVDYVDVAVSYVRFGGL